MPNKYCAGHNVRSLRADVMACTPHSLLHLLPAPRPASLSPAKRHVSEALEPALLPPRAALAWSSCRLYRPCSCAGSLGRWAEADCCLLQKKEWIAQEPTQEPTGVRPSVCCVLFLQAVGPYFSVLLSDLCPSTSGADVTDVAASLGLSWRALELASGDSLLPTWPSHAIPLCRPASANSHAPDVSSTEPHETHSQQPSAKSRAEGPNSSARAGEPRQMSQEVVGREEQELAFGVLGARGHLVLKTLEGDGFQGTVHSAVTTLRTHMFSTLHLVLA